MNIENQFLSKEHLERFNQLLYQDSNYSSNETNSLFFIISGNNKLWKCRDKIYDTDKHCIKTRTINSLILSSSEKAILLAGLNLFNSHKCYTLIDTFASLDSNNFKLVINAIRIRFPYK